MTRTSPVALRLGRPKTAVFGGSRLGRASAWLGRALTTLLLVAGFLTSGQALGASVRTEVSARRVAVGETFTVRVTVLLGDDDAQAIQPELPVQGEAELHGPSLGTQRRVVMHNFDFRTENNVIATWSVTPTKPGKLALGPAQIKLGNALLKSERIVVEVVDGPPQNRPRSRSLRGRDPFGFGADPFGQDPFDDADPFDLLRRRRLERYPEAPPDLALGRARDPIAFLHARVSQQHAVVGEPVVLEIFAYGSRGTFREISPTEPALPDFLSYPAVETSHEQPTQRVDLAGTEFLVVKLREFILVPLKTGQLEVGPMKAILRGGARNYPARGSQLGTEVESQALTLSVGEPPAKGRPPGYRLGDVGQFRLSATVRPRQLDQHEFASVQVEVRGSGNVPASLNMPDLPGVIWGKPTVRGELAVQNGRLEGHRLIEFTPQVKRAGRVVLGEVVLPFYDPEASRYETARVDLGALQVAPAAAATPRPDGANDTLASPTDDAPLAPRHKLGAYALPKAPPPAWLALAAALLPLGMLLVLWLPSGLRRALRAVSGALQRGPRLNLTQAEAASRRGDLSETARELEKAGYHLIEEQTGLRGRGVLRARLGGELEARGLSVDLATRLSQFFLELEEMRYRAGDDEAGDEARAVFDRGRSLLQELLRAKPKRGGAK